MLKNKTFTLCCLALVLLSGCGKSPKVEYQPQTLYDLNFFSSDDYSKQDDITVFVKRFDRDDCQFYFKKNRLSSLVPLQVTIMNETNQDIAFNPESINMPLANHKAIKKSLRPSFARSFGMFFLAPTTLIGGTIALVIYAAGTAALSYLWAPILIVVGAPSLYMGIKDANQHTHHLKAIKEKSDILFEQKMRVHPTTIKAGETISCLLFVHRSAMQPRLMFDLYTTEGQKVQTISLHLARG